MATWVYKDGEGTLIDAHDVTNHLDAGYTLDKNPKPEKKEFFGKRLLLPLGVPHHLILK